VVDIDKAAWCLRYLNANYPWAAHRRVFFEGNDDDDDLQRLSSTGVVDVDWSRLSYEGGPCWSTNTHLYGLVREYISTVIKCLQPSSRKLLRSFNDGCGKAESDKHSTLLRLGLIARVHEATDTTLYLTDFGREVLRQMED
jgi:hypothetical protein